MVRDEKPARLVRKPTNLFRTLFNILSVGIPLIGLCAALVAIFRGNHPYIKIFCALGGMVLLAICLYVALSRTAWICSQCREEITLDESRGLSACPHCKRELKLPRAIL